MERESIEVGGVRFTAEEVVSVTLRRNGRKVTIEGKRRPRRGSKVVGFRHEDVEATEGDERDSGDGEDGRRGSSGNRR